MSFVNKLPMPHRKLDKFDPVGRAVHKQMADSPTSKYRSGLTNAIMNRRAHGSASGATPTTKPGL